jgi:hypothetical protein
VQQPSVGRIVHYVSYGTPGGEFLPEHRAAVITEVPEMVTNATPTVVGLCVLNPLGYFFHPLAAGGCAHDEDTKKGGTWHWPERVEATP